jgi:hypothetical protein
MNSTNTLNRLFPYLRFLKANYSMDWKTFQRYFCDTHADDSHNRIATLLSYTMMRRTMKTTILNRAIITLPEPHPDIQYVNFSDEERIIYRIVSLLYDPGLFSKADSADRKSIPRKPERILCRRYSRQMLCSLPRPTLASSSMHLSPFHA